MNDAARSNKPMVLTVVQPPPTRWLAPFVPADQHSIGRAEIGACLFRSIVVATATDRAYANPAK